jgi:hypothetical protein
MVTCPFSAALSAKESPATPLPMTRKSVFRFIISALAPKKVGYRDKNTKEIVNLAHHNQIL